jgi:hypothetical protein
MRITNKLIEIQAAETPLPGAGMRCILIQPGAVDFDFIFQRPAVCHDQLLRYQM